MESPQIQEAASDAFDDDVAAAAHADAVVVVAVAFVADVADASDVVA